MATAVLGHGGSECPALTPLLCEPVAPRLRCQSEYGMTVVQVVIVNKEPAVFAMRQLPGVWRRVCRARPAIPFATAEQQGQETE